MTRIEGLIPSHPAAASQLADVRIESLTLQHVHQLISFRVNDEPSDVVPFVGMPETVRCGIVYGVGRYVSERVSDEPFFVSGERLEEEVDVVYSLGEYDSSCGFEEVLGGRKGV